VKQPEAFAVEAERAVDTRIAQLRSTLAFATASALPEAQFEDVVIAGKEVLFTVFRQSNIPFLAGQVLVTVQVARHGLGGVVSFQTEKGLVFSPGHPVRDATPQELQDSGSLGK
jgi:hypothetical protein